MSQPTIIREPNEFGGRLKFYSRTADAAYWDRLWGSTPRSYKRAEKGLLPRHLDVLVRRWFAPGATVLEAGCGQGNFTVALTARGYRAEGVDWAAQTVEQLQNRFPRINFFEGDARGLQVPDGRYDGVYSPGVVEHFEEGPEEILRETYRVLRPGGIALIDAPCFNVYLRSRGRFDTVSNGEFYQYAFTELEMTSILEDLGFDVPEVFLYGSFRTLRLHGPAVAGRLGRTGVLLGMAFDRIRLFQRWGRGAVWVARHR